MQINNNGLRIKPRNLPKSTQARISKIKELFKNARTMKEKIALAKELSTQSPI